MGLIEHLLTYFFIHVLK